VAAEAGNNLKKEGRDHQALSWVYAHFPETRACRFTNVDP
jgi:hypothetical protein